MGNKRLLIGIILLVLSLSIAYILLFEVKYKVGIGEVIGWNDKDDNGNTLYTLTVYNFDKEKIEEYIVEKETYDESMLHLHLKIYRKGISKNYVFSFIMFENVLCDG